MSYKNYYDFTLNLINESFDYNETYFKLMPLEHFKIVEKNGYLSPVGIITKNENKYNGNWTIPLSNINEWLIQIKYFGSPLQALLMKRAVNESPTVLLHLKLDKNENKIYNRDITKMFVEPSFKGYFNSFTENQEYKINESFITGKIYDFKVIKKFNVPFKLSEYFAEPQSILDFLYNNEQIKYTSKKMTSISKAMLKVIFKKIFTFNFKNF